MEPSNTFIRVSVIFYHITEHSYRHQTNILFLWIRTGQGNQLSFLHNLFTSSQPKQYPIAHTSAPTNIGRKACLLISKAHAHTKKPFHRKMTGLQSIDVRKVFEFSWKSRHKQLSRTSITKLIHRNQCNSLTNSLHIQIPSCHIQLYNQKSFCYEVHLLSNRAGIHLHILKE